MSQLLPDMVLQAIADKHIAMRPAWHFTIRRIASQIFTVTLAVAAVATVSLAVLSLRLHTTIYTPRLAKSGLDGIIRQYPWSLTICALLLVSILAWRVRTMRRFRGVASAQLYVAIVVMALLAGTALSLSPWSLAGHTHNRQDLLRIRKPKAMVE